jgi:uncharacterized protein (TIGR00369 family)
MIITSSLRCTFTHPKTTLTKFANFSSSHYGGLSKVSFCGLIETMFPLIREFYKPKVVSLVKDNLVVSLPYRKEFIGNPLIPCQHGGVVATLIDHVGASCAWSTLTDSNYRVGTIDLRVDYIRPAPCEELIFEAVLVSKTKQLIRVDVTCWDSKQTKKIAIGRCLFNIYNGKSDLNLLVDELKRDGFL